MSSKAQIEANRQNAQKSTGPKTEEGKAAVSQNAIKHGLTARQDVIATESQELYDLRRDQMLEELNPTGLIEKMLAERIVSLSWRLDRAATMQTDALNSMMVDQCYFPSSAAEHATSPRSYPTRSEYFTPNTDLLLGCAVRNDIRDNKVLDRLLMYERRIERSLYKTMAELRDIQKSRKQSQSRTTEEKSIVRQSKEFTLDSDSGPQQPGNEPTRTYSPETSHTQTQKENMQNKPNLPQSKDDTTIATTTDYNEISRTDETKENHLEPANPPHSSTNLPIHTSPENPQTNPTRQVPHMV